MSQALELLNSLSETVVDHKHVVPDSDTYFLIDPYTRQIENTNYQKTVLMRGDHNSERFTFEVPRYVDGHDMSLCNRVIVHFDNVGDSIENVYSDVAYMDDLRINPDKPETVISSWLIRREATQIVGLLSFSLQYQCVEGDEVTYEWNTDSYDDIEIRKSKNNGEAAVINYTNVLEQWRSQIFGAGDSVMSNITTEGANQVAAVQTESATQQAAIELKGSDTLATIPDDYTAVYNMADKALRTKGDGVVCKAEGSVITVDDSSNDHIRGLNVYGKTTQFTTTGKNLFTFDEPPKVNRIAYDESTQKVTVTASDSELAVVQHMHRFDTPIPAGTTVTVTAWFDSGLTGPNSSLAIGGYHEAETGSSWQGNFVINSNTNVAGTTKTATFVTTDTVTSIVFFANAGSTLLEDFVFKLQFEVGDVATDYEPYTGGIAAPNPDYPQELVFVENPTVNVNGKNLFDISKIVAKETITPLSDGTISVSHYYNPTHIALRELAPGLVVGTKCLLNIDTDGCTFLYLSKYGHIWNDNTVLEITDVVLDSQVCLYGKTEQVDGSTIIRSIQVVAEGQTSEYEKYSGTQSIALVNTLRGIPVTSGGNYTDSDGQQWICDEVDLERGVYIQRVAKDVLDGINTPVHKNGNASDKYLYYYGTAENNLRVPGYCTHFTHLDAYTENPSQYGTFNLTKASAAYFNGYGIVSGDNASVSDSTEFNNWIHEQYEAGTPVTIYYAIATPIETPLTAEEIMAYRALKSNYPNTTVLSDAGAWMKIKYNADTKLYIAKMADNRAASMVEEVLNDDY